MLVNSEDTNKDIREKALKRLLELSLKSLGEIPQLSEPSYEQKAWFVRQMKSVRRS